jgi:osmotically inducible protein OsmC
LPEGTAVDTEVDLGTSKGEYFLQARLNVSLPGLAEETARTIIELAHQTCPYSKATRGNINVVISVSI